MLRYYRDSVGVLTDSTLKLVAACTKTFLLDYVKEYGPINRFVIANHQIVCLSSPELLEV